MTDYSHRGNHLKSALKTHLLQVVIVFDGGLFVGRLFILDLTEIPDNRKDVSQQRHSPGSQWPGQFIRFGLVGGLNTLLDLLVLNSLLWLFPTTNMIIMLLFNSCAYSIGAIESFLFNKYWTFRYYESIAWSEVKRFIIITLLGIGCNNLIIWLANYLFHPLRTNTFLWTNVAKLIAIAGTVFVSFLGMRLWVFVQRSQQKDSLMKLSHQANSDTPATAAQGYQKNGATVKSMPVLASENEDTAHMTSSLSIVLPAYNEEQVIAQTVSDVLAVLPQWTNNFEIIVVNDGSKDQTAAIVMSLCAQDMHVRLVSHTINQGYGAALVSGFTAASKELTFFMDSDGQFDIRDLQNFFSFIEEYDAVIGYRINRQDKSIRKLNAWGWKQLVRLMLGVHVRDIDCAFKLLHTDFLHTHPLTTHGAMINAELLYKLKQTGCRYKELGVQHLPRRSGQATGANPAVIMRALRELFVYASRWRREQSDWTRNRTMEEAAHTP
jgi:putative flippase GtrA